MGVDAALYVSGCSQVMLGVKVRAIEMDQIYPHC